jgi:hypothetical protein
MLIWRRSPREKSTNKNLKNFWPLRESWTVSLHLIREFIWGKGWILTMECGQTRGSCWDPKDGSAIHCEKSLFVLASRQKIPVLRTENPAVNTRTICLPPIEFFKIPHARKATAVKSRPETTDTAGKSRPSGPWRETYYIPMPEKLRPENPSKQQQIPPENPADSKSRNGRKIRSVTTDTARKSRPVKTETTGKSCCQWLKKRPKSLIIDAIEPLD